MVEVEKPKRRNDIFWIWVVLAVIAVVASVVIVKLLNNTMTSSEKRHTKEVTGYVGTLYDGFVSVSQQELLPLVENPDITALATNLSPASRQAAAAVVTSSKNSSTTLKAVGVFDEKGTLLAQNQQSSDLLGNGVSTQSFFKQAVDEKKALISGAFVPPTLGTNSQAFVLPIVSNDKVDLVIVGLVDLDTFKTFIKDTQADTAFTSIYDAQGNILITTSPDTAVSDTEKEAIKNLLSKDVGTTEVSSEDSGFTARKKGMYYAVAVTQNDEFIARSTRQIFLIIIGAALVIHVVIMSLAAFRNIHLQNRINDLILVVQSMTKSGISTPVNESEKTGRDALSELAREIDALQNKNKAK